MNFFAYFPSIICRDEQPNFVETLLNNCIKIKEEKKTEGETFFQSNDLKDEYFIEEFKKHVLSSAVNLLSVQGYSVEKYNFFVSSLWFQELGKGAATNAHFHKNSQICGWFFLEAPEKGSYPVYYDTRINKNMIELDFVQTEEITNATNVIHFNNVQNGTVIFAPSWIQHQLTVNRSEMPTRCIHFIISN
jgi:uncharacterized protein (TIGR02466 family)